MDLIKFMKKVIVLNYNNGIVYIVDVPMDMDIEHYLYDVVGFKESETYWMEFKGVIKNLTLTDYSI